MDIPGIPRLPTDNLYKFVAMSGVLMLLFGFGVIAYGLVRLDSDWQPLVMESNVRDARMEAANTYWTRSNALARRGGGAKSVEALRDSARSVWDSLSQSERLFQARRTNVKSRQDTLDIFVVAAFILIVVGILLAISGFVNWYVKLQKPLDEIVRRRANSLSAADDEAAGPDVE